MEGSPDLRVSDQEREHAAEALREHYALGRLSEHELNQRVQAVYDARTQQELRTRLGDLPALPATPQQLKAELAERRHRLQRQLIQQAGGAATPFLICVVIWAASGATGGFWPIWVAIPLILLVVRNGWRLYGPSPELDRVERELERRSRGGGRSGPSGQRRRHGSGPRHHRRY